MKSKQNYIFLDIDGVFNCDLYYNSIGFADYKEANKVLRKQVKNGEISKLDYYAKKICKERVKLFNKVCKETNSVAVISSTWRKRLSIEELQEIFNYCGGEFTIIDKTEDLGYERGVEISKWIRDFMVERYGLDSIMMSDLSNYAILDDGNDMLMNQATHFFKTERYAGLNPYTANNMIKFLNSATIKWEF